MEKRWGKRVVEKWIGKAQRIFTAVKLFCMILCWYVCAKSLWSYPTLCDPIDCSLLGSSVYGMYITWHFTFFQTNKMDHTAVDSNVNSGFWMTVMCQYRFTGCNKCTTLMAGIDHDGGHACVQSGRYMGNLSLPLILPWS